MKIDVRRYDRLWSLGSSILRRRKAGTMRRQEISSQLIIQLGRIGFINASDVSGGPRRQTTKLLHDGFLVIQKALAEEVVVAIQTFEKILELGTEQQRAELLAVCFLNVDQRMPPIKMGQDEICNRRNAEGRGKI